MPIRVLLLEALRSRQTVDFIEIERAMQISSAEASSAGQSELLVHINQK
jgi:hypothetical protein